MHQPGLCHRIAFSVGPTGLQGTYVYLYGNNSFCETASLGVTGLPVDRGSQVWTAPGPKSWQYLRTGLRHVLKATPVMFFCQLEPGGQIGTFAVED
jgi:hypothetical protein